MHIAVLTTGRQDWSIFRSTCQLIADHPDLRLTLLAGGMHLSEKHGRTIDAVRQAGFEPLELPWTADGDHMIREGSEALTAVGDALETERPDCLLLLGDRYETLTAAVAATLTRTPIAHLHGGEETLGALDDVLRHAITRLSHLHLVSHHDHADRVARLGEDPATIHVVGAPGLDNVWREDLATREDLERRFGGSLTAPLVVVTVHPETLAADPSAAAEAVVGAMRRVPATYVITLPNSDPGHTDVRRMLLDLAATEPRVHAVESLGADYWALLRQADAVLGNSSSALIEAPVVSLPAVNVGSRQAGRLRGDNIIDAEPNVDDVTRALEAAVAPDAKSKLSGASPYGDGRSAVRIVQTLLDWTPPHPPSKAPV